MLQMLNENKSDERLLEGLQTVFTEYSELSGNQISNQPTAAQLELFIDDFANYGFHGTPNDIIPK